MRREDVDAIFAEHWRGSGMGSILADEVMWVQGLIEEHRPRHFLEIGMASGISAGIFAHLLDEHGGELITTVDYDNTFFGDRTKENGFLIEPIYPGGRVTVEKQPHKIAPDVVDFGHTYEMAFIDANHQQPFPLLDTLAIWPVLTGPKVVVHHDLRLYKDQVVPYGVGPKYVFDQFPDAVKERSQARGGNIFALRLGELTQHELEDIAVDGLLLPWTMRTPMAPWIHRKLRPFLEQHYAPRVLEAFDTAFERYNVAFSVGGQT